MRRFDQHRKKPQGLTPTQIKHAHEHTNTRLHDYTVFGPAHPHNRYFPIAPFNTDFIFTSFYQAEMIIGSAIY